MIEGEKELISDMRIKNIMILNVLLHRASFFVAAKKKRKRKRKRKRNEKKVAAVDSSK